MFTRIRRLTSRFFSNSRKINNEPLNKVSLIVIILIDIFILINVFAGLDDISRWYLSPTDTYPCYSDWNHYQTQTTQERDYDIIKSSLSNDAINWSGFQQNYQQLTEGHLGQLSPTCLTFAGYQDKINSTENRKIAKTIEQKQATIGQLEQTNATIRSQYDSTLLERIANQPREQSINLVGAEKAKQNLDQNNQKIAALKTEITNLKQELLTKPESVNFLAFLKHEQEFRTVEQGYKRAAFWYPSIQLIFQAVFLLPLILIALLVHNFAQRKGYGLVSLISWHLLVIFFIPLILKVLEFLQVGVIFQFLFDLIKALFGGLLFLINYLYILMIPLIGFGIIKFFQRTVLNSKLQAAKRVQSSCCIKCARRIRHQDAYCPHCDYYQYVECPNCHDFTYKHLPYCKQCGYAQDLTRS